MKDWADDALTKLHKQRMAHEESLERQRIEKVHGRALWQEIRRMVDSNCASLNAQADKTILIPDLTQNKELRVSFCNDGEVRVMHAEFDDETGRLSWDCGAKSGGWSISVTDDGAVQFQRGMMPTTIPLIANGMLDTLLFDGAAIE
jgi:hypothetical protein